jgi:SHS2 domain-containing protein
MRKVMPHSSDLEILVEAGSFEGLVRESVIALTEAVAGNVGGDETRELKVEGSHEEKLMRVLEEVVYLQSAELFYARDAKLVGNKVVLTGGKAKVRGEIKAVTWHEFWVKGTKAHFICDL